MTEADRVRGRLGVLGLALWSVITVAWWALALWPTGPTPADWLVRARAVCFNAAPSGLPSASGWLLLIGQPIGMLAALMVIWGDSVRLGLRALGSQRMGRGALALLALLLLAGMTSAALRVRQASAVVAVEIAGDLPPATYPRLNRPLPEFRLVDQAGESVDARTLAGRPMLLTFAFGHCESVCPAVVHQAGEAVRVLKERQGEQAPTLWVVSLDPWRDTPSRLPQLHAQWMLPEGARALSGDPADVNAFLDALGVPRERDLTSGDIVHPTLLFLIDRAGRIAFASTGSMAQVLALSERL